MPVTSLVAATLRLIREAEDALELFPPGTPDHETARLLIVELRAVYSELTDVKYESTLRVRSSLKTIERAHLVLAGLRADPDSN